MPRGPAGANPLCCDGLSQRHVQRPRRRLHPIRDLSCPEVCTLPSPPPSFFLFLPSPCRAAETGFTFLSNT